MIYALTQEPEKYNLGSNGLYASYGHDPHLFCLMSMTSPVFFLWEDLFEDLPTSSRVVRLDLKQEEAYIKTLEQEIGGRTVPELMEHMSPREFAEFLKVAQPLDLEVVKTFGLPKPEANLAALYMSTHIRALQHEKFYRGKIYKEGNKTEIAFKSRLTKQEDEYLEKAKAEFRRQYLIKIGAKA